jgi:hypothetical protein
MKFRIYRSFGRGEKELVGELNGTKAKASALNLEYHKQPQPQQPITHGTPITCLKVRDFDENVAPITPVILFKQCAVCKRYWSHDTGWVEQPKVQFTVSSVGMCLSCANKISLKNGTIAERRIGTLGPVKAKRIQKLVEQFEGVPKGRPACLQYPATFTKSTRVMKFPGCPDPSCIELTFTTQRLSEAIGGDSWDDFDREGD